MSLRERLGFGRQENIIVSNHQEIERRDLAHSALFAEVVELHDVCKFLLNGHKNHIITVDDKPVFIITCLDGNTIKIKYSSGTTIDDFSVSSSNISRNTTQHLGDKNNAKLISFNITKSCMNGFTEEHMTDQLKALYDLQEAMLIADGYILPAIEADEDYYAA